MVKTNLRGKEKRIKDDIEEGEVREGKARKELMIIIKGRVSEKRDTIGKENIGSQGESAQGAA